MSLTKRPLTLIEVCIALGLMAIIVYTLFSSLIQTVKISKSLETIKSKTLETSFFYNRLLHIFSHTNPNTLVFKKDGDGFITSVKFSFENGLDPSLLFSGTREALIYSDHNHNLILEIYARDNSAVQTEILLSNIKEFSWKPTTPFFLTLELKLNDDLFREFVFFFSDRQENSEAFAI